MHGFALFCISGKKLVKIRAKSRPQRPGYPGSRTIAAWGFLERCNLLLRLGKNNVFGFSWFGMIPEVIFSRLCAREQSRELYTYQSENVQAHCSRGLLRILLRILLLILLRGA
jgi:hypothetical protein